MSEKGKHPIRVITQKTGLSSHVIRVWEKRYRAIQPSRTPTNRRLYSDDDLARLLLLKRATMSGRSIGTVAALPTEDLVSLLKEDESLSAPAPRQLPTPTQDDTAPPVFLAACLEATKRLDAAALEETLLKAAVGLSQPKLIDEVIVPLLHRIGECWRDGSMRIAHEHMASAIVRSLLGRLHANTRLPAGAPRIIVSTPSGQLHELGACVVAVSAGAAGWEATYLGPQLPAEEIAGAATQNNARAVALSLIYPADDPMIVIELQKLRNYLPQEVAILVGGRAASVHREFFSSIGATYLQDVQSLRIKLEALRHGELK